jgi:hypothetical protein
VIKRPRARKCLNLLSPLSVEAGVNWDFVVFVIIIYANCQCTPYILLACYIPVVIVSDFNPTL